MYLPLLFNAALAILVFVSTMYYLIRRAKFEYTLKIDLSVLGIGVIYLFFSAILFLWSFSYFTFDQQDFFVVYAIVLVAQVIALITILYAYNSHRNLIYTLVALVLLLPLAIISPSYLHLVVPFCLFVILLSFIIFSDSHQTSTALLIGYACFSLLAYLSTLIWPNSMIVLAGISTLLFLFFIHTFLKQLEHKKRPFLPPPHFKKEEHLIVNFLKHFIFIIIITNFIFIGTIGIHEVGHLGASQMIQGCDGNRIVYEINSLPHTQVECEDTSAKQIWILAGILLPLFVSAMLFFGGGESIKEIALQIVGINLVISFLDFQALGLSKALSAFILFIGGFIFILSLVLLARARTQ